MKLGLLLSLCFSGMLAVAQTPKKPLDHGVYDRWQSVSSEEISKNGKWVAYSVVPQEGDAELRIHSLSGNHVVHVPRVKEATFSANSQFTIFLINPFFQEVRTARIKKKKPFDMPKDSLGIVENGKPGVKKFSNVKSFSLPERSSQAVAIQLHPTDSTKKAGADLIIYQLITKAEKRITNVKEFIWSNNGKLLAYITAASKKDSTSRSGLYVYDTPRATTHRVSEGRSDYGNLAFDEAGTQLAFTMETRVKKPDVKKQELGYFTLKMDSVKVLAGSATPGIPKDWEVSPNGKTTFSANGKKLFFGTSRIATPKDTSLIEFENAKLDIWNYKDDYLQPMQLKNLEKELKRSFRAVIHLDQPTRIVQLADEDITELQPGNEGNADYALGYSNAGHRISTQWEGSGYRDIYLISLKDGSKIKIAEGIKDKPDFSPLGKHVVWYNRHDNNWYSYNVHTKSRKSLTGHLKQAFYDEQNDVPDQASPYGLCAFEAEDKSVLIYDRYDIWKFPLENTGAYNVTAGYGRKNKITFRYYDLEKSRTDRLKPDVDIVKSGKTLYLDAFNNITKEAGWYSTTLTANNAPRKLAMGPVGYSRPFLLSGSSLMIYRKESYTQSPDLYVSRAFSSERQLSSINPWQKDYTWGTAELVKWNTPASHSAEGVLYKPENFDPNRKYPMIVYFYEKVTDNLNRYIPPAPTPSRLNISFFVSNGYLVFTPDISYETGYPGRSAEEYINSGVNELKKNSWVDGSRIGIQGQSWGGYQVAHLITRTNMYAAAWAGAPVVNMFSAYGGIRWETGMSRQFQYEKTQSRIGATIWEKPELYKENSPLFFLDRVNTPVAIMANDADGAVPWYQGIEMFTALRRLNKPVWMLNYNNEAHNLVQRQNRKDIQKREQQFFDHYLKGAPIPVWMDKGVPATEKGKNWGFDLVKP
ncbi:MAG: prolyl oligopeptidase family serine peptidase [Arcticibacter sp.]